MNLFEKLNRLDDSLVESKRVIKKKKLTESYSNEMTEFMNWIQDYRNGALWNDFTAEFESEQDPDISVVLTWLENFDEDAYYDYADADTYDEIDEMLTESTNRVKVEVKYETYGRYGDGGDIKTGRVSGSTEVEALMKMLDHVHMYTDSDYAEEFKEENGRYPTTEEVTDKLYEQNGDGCDLIYWIRNLTTGEMIFDGAVEESEPEEWDDDIDEMLTESTEQYDLSTLVKDSIYHLVSDLGKDPMADNFGDDVCGDLENNYDIDVPQNPVKYADWCDAVMCEVSRQLNNKEELTESCEYTVKRYGEWHWGIIGPDKLMLRQDNGKLILFKSKDKAVEYIDTLCKNTLIEGNNVC